MNWRIEELQKLRGYVVEWSEPGNYILSKRNRLYSSVSLEPPFTQIAEIHAPTWKRLASQTRLAQRLFRFMVSNAVPLANGDMFVSFDKSVGIIRKGEYKELSGLRRPCRILRSACAVTEDGSVYFGEYLPNTERGPMYVYRYSPGKDSLEVAYEFPAGSIRHVHGVYYDKISRSLYCLTGDAGSECRMMKTQDGFASIETIGEGDETWRAVSVLFDENRFLYGMDAEFETNKIYSFDRATGERTEIGDVSGTVFYSHRSGHDSFFATTAEGAPSQIENVAAIWHVSENGTLTEVAKFKKDLWHATLFQFGTIAFPHVASPSEEVYFHVVAAESDNRTFRLRKAE